MLKMVDYQIIEFFSNLRSPVLTSFFKAVTFLGDATGVVLGVGIIFLILFILDKNYLFKISFILKVVIIAIFSQFILKFIFSRSRPDLWPPLISSLGYSFPSGHSTITTVLYGISVYYLLKSNNNKLVKIICSFVLVSLIFFVGISRIYLGVHWPSDVLFGWILGAGLIFLMLNFKK